MKSQRQRPCTERSAEDNSLGRENTLLPSWKNCIGCQWNSELITKPCRWLTNAYEGTAPEYLQELIPRYVHERPLLSSSQPRLLIPSAAEKHSKKQFGFQAFSNSASKLWNALPQTVREANTLAAFRERLKTPVLWMTLHHVSFSLPPPPPPALIERHHQQQQKATKQSISLRQPRTTPCSHGSWNRLNWDGVCVWVCVWGRSTDSPSPRPTPPRDDGGKDYIPHHHQNQLSFQTGFNLGSSWTYVMFTICSPFLCTWCLCSVAIVFSLISIVFIGCELLFLGRPSLLVFGERIKKAIILCGSKFFFLSSEYLQAVMARFSVVVAIVVCYLVTDSYGSGVDPVPGKYTRCGRYAECLVYVYQADDQFTVYLVDVLGW